MPRFDGSDWIRDCEMARLDRLGSVGGSWPGRSLRLKRRDRSIGKRLAGPMALAARNGGQAAVPGQEARVEAHAARVAAEDPGKERPRCWGPCGRTLAGSKQPRAYGWWCRRVRIKGGGTAVEMHCPTCFAAWGWIEPRKGA